MKILVDSGADLSSTTNKGKTALDLALERNLDYVVEVLQPKKPKTRKEKMKKKSKKKGADVELSATFGACAFFHFWHRVLTFFSCRYVENQGITRKGRISGLSGGLLHWPRNRRESQQQHQQLCLCDGTYASRYFEQLAANPVLLYGP